jgi:hypothetical protein
MLKKLNQGTPFMSDDILVKVEGVSKILSLPQRSLWYGVQDVASEMLI